jgi:hypothetical protein
MTEERWRRPEPGAHRDQVAVADAAADTEPLPAYQDDLSDHSDLAAELAAAAPRRWWNKVTIYLGAAALLVGGFVAGAEVQQAYGQPSSPNGARSNGGAGGLFNAGNAGGNAGRGNLGGGNVGGGSSGAGSTAAAPATTGKVKLVDGTTVYVETAGGDVVTVRTNGQTKVETASPSSLKALAAGDSVTVTGQSSGDGTVTATTVTETK